MLKLNEEHFDNNWINLTFPVVTICANSLRSFHAQIAPSPAGRKCRLSKCSADALSRARQRLIKSARRPGADLDVKINKINKKYKNCIYFQCLTVHLRMKK